MPEKTGVLGKVGTRKEKKVKGTVGTRGVPTTTPVALVQAGENAEALPTTGFGGTLPLALLGIAGLAGGALMLRRSHSA